MAGAVAELVQSQPVFEEGQVISIPDQLFDFEAVDRAEELIRIAGRLSIEAWQPEPVEVQNSTPIFENLEQAIKAASNGNPVARKMVRTNVLCDAVERTIKAGNIMEVELDYGESNNITQHGQNLESIQINTLVFASNNVEMGERSRAETRNACRLEQRLELGYLRDHTAVVISRVPDKMAKAEMERAGFFTDTMSLVIQSTTQRDDVLVMESAFIAGVIKPNGERHDAQAVARLGDKLKVDLRDKSATETIDTPMLIPNILIPNGVVDIAELLDDCIYEVTGVETFLGEAKPKQDYLEFKDFCIERQAGFEGKVELITNELIAEDDTINSPVGAIQKLHELSEKHMVEHAINDHSINPMVFGYTSATHIEMARWHIEEDNPVAAKKEVEAAQQTAQSSSCPSGLNSQKEPGNSKSTEKDCVFKSTQCPVCGAKNVKTTVSVLSKTRKIIRGECGCHKIIKTG